MFGNFSINNKCTTVEFTKYDFPISKISNVMSMYNPCYKNNGEKKLNLNGVRMTKL